VTKPKYLKNEVATSDLPGSSDEMKQASYHDSNDNTAPNDIGEPPYSDDDLLQSLPPVLDQLEGHVPGRYFQTLMHVYRANRLERPREIILVRSSSRR